MSRINKDILRIFEMIGNTPLLDITPPGLTSRIYAKAEYCNLTGSVKDRAAYAMILEGLNSGALNSSKRILEATSGNTGIGLAVIGRLLGFSTTLVMPSQVNRDRRDILESAGAEFILSDPAAGSNGALLKTLHLFGENPERWFWPNQYYNPANYLVHTATAEEIFKQTSGEVTHFVCATGTGGTAIGVAQGLKKLNPKIRAISVEPAEEMHGIEGTKHMAVEAVPDILVGKTVLTGIFQSKRSLLDQTDFVSTSDAYAGLNRLAGQGLYVGISSGANYMAACRLAEKNPGSVIVTVFPDSSDRYLSEALWDEKHYGMQLSYKTSREIRFHFERAYPHEGCGLLFGIPDINGRRNIQVFEPVENINHERASDRYQINPAEMLLMEKKQRQNGLKLLGIAHSHPNALPRPSEFDMERAWENLSYIIYSVVGGAVVGIKSWTLTDTPSSTGGAREELIRLV
jgi:cysteine synthase B